MIYDLIVAFIGNVILETAKAAGKAAFERFDEKELKDALTALLQRLRG